MRALIGYSTSEYPALFLDSRPVPPSDRRQTGVKCEQNAFPFCCRKQRSFTTKQAVPEIHEESDEVRFGSFNGKALSFLLEFIDRTSEKVFVSEMQIILSLALLSFT